jgi:hypothetical protein
MGRPRNYLTQIFAREETVQDSSLFRSLEKTPPHPEREVAIL